MTPQLYINYKLKSVEHLPWRTLIYKFLNTIIDDLFAFVITMPWMKRLSCFRDGNLIKLFYCIMYLDIIFLIYLYQRWVYRVDIRRDALGNIINSKQTTTDAQNTEQKAVEEKEKKE